MNITLAGFQLKVIAELMEAMLSEEKEIVLKSCTGSGKTIMLTHFMDNYLRCFDKTVFVWLTPGKGNLEEQSKEKMDRYVHGSRTKLLYDVMVSGFEENDCCFINWEKLTKKGNNALKDSEHINFAEHINNALNESLSFKIIIDESHHNNTIKAEEIVECFKTDKIIRCSATPKNHPKAYFINVSEKDVIKEGLIKKMIIINENIGKETAIKSQTEFLINKAIKKQQELKGEYVKKNSDVNPLIIVQLPNNSSALLEEVENYFYSQNITYENKKLAVWLADKKENIDNIEKNNGEPEAIIIKQAIATGWDCPRAQILVKLRDNMNEVFEIQTIGRIRRMPEAKHYDSELLDCCYLYTLDEKFTENVKQSMGKNALDAMKLFVKPERKNFSIMAQYKTNVPVPRDGKLALQVIYTYLSKKYNLDNKIENNRLVFQAEGYDFSQSIVFRTKTGNVVTTEKGTNNLESVQIEYKYDKKKYGREYHYNVSQMGLKVNLDYNSTNAIIRKLFLKNVKSKYSLLELDNMELYAFVINNKQKLIDEIRQAMADENSQLSFKYNMITEKPVSFPKECIFTYDGTAKTQVVMEKNVYKGYLASAEVRSASEKLFEEYCETSENIEWVYKNGDKGSEYFSLVYEDNNNRQKSFYPDYIVGLNDGSVWIIETKGGFSKEGNSEDIDLYTPKKFKALKRYLDRFQLYGGIVRQDKQSMQLCICTEHYSENLKSGDWKLLNDVL
ncbi:MAG: DEAD/DEAH box helicase [Eubacterium sp.]